jgi:hypothetical protein
MENNQVMVHVRFAIDGTVKEIGERPAEVGVQEWFNRLSVGAANYYQALAGGRGVFRVPSELIETLKVTH